MMPIDVQPGDPPYEPAPPPWTLTGRGFVALFRKPGATVLDRWIPAALREAYAGGPACLMCVDYAASDAGPYRELLFVPGRFRIAGGTYPIITRIVVSTWASVANGRLNWAIPKEEASFEVEREGATERWRVARGEETLADIRFRASGLPLPVTTSVLPASWATVVQPRGDEWVMTHLKASGRCRMATRVVSRFPGSAFPEPGQGGPTLAAVVNPFRMVFPVPRVVAVRSDTANAA